MIRLGRDIYYPPNVSLKAPLYIRASGDALSLEAVVTLRAKKTRMTGFHGGYPKIALAHAGRGEG